MLSRSFTYYTLFERFATLVGPISWGAMVALASKTDFINYKAALLTMMFYVVIGYILAFKLPKEDGKAIALK